MKICGLLVHGCIWSWKDAMGFLVLDTLVLSWQSQNTQRCAGEHTLAYSSQCTVQVVDVHGYTYTSTVILLTGLLPKICTVDSCTSHKTKHPFGLKCYRLRWVAIFQTPQKVVPWTRLVNAGLFEAVSPVVLVCFLVGRCHPQWCMSMPSTSELDQHRLQIHPLGKGETSTNYHILGFHVSFRGCSLFRFNWAKFNQVASPSWKQKTDDRTANMTPLKNAPISNPRSETRKGLLLSQIISSFKTISKAFKSYTRASRSWLSSPNYQPGPRHCRQWSVQDHWSWGDKTWW